MDHAGLESAGAASTPVAAAQSGYVNRAYAGLAPHHRLLLLILLTNVAVIAVDRIFAAMTTAPNFTEYGPATTLKVAETALTGALGIAIFASLGTVHGLGRYFWLVAGIGLCWLAFDDYAQVHERVSWALDDRQAPLVTHWDDLVVLGYALAGAVALILFRHEVFSAPAVSVLLGLGVVASAIMVLFDGAADPESSLSSAEDWANMVASALFLAAFAVKWREVRGATSG
jgi:hypothetical protein